MNQDFKNVSSEQTSWHIEIVYKTNTFHSAKSPEKCLSIQDAGKSVFIEKKLITEFFKTTLADSNMNSLEKTFGFQDFKTPNSYISLALGLNQYIKHSNTYLINHIKWNRYENSIHLIRV